jgi:uncharacterized protein YcaQ
MQNGIVWSNNHMRYYIHEVCMVPRLDLSRLRERQTPEQLAGNRQKSLDMVQRFQTAQKELERVCAEKGIPVPIMVC